MENKPLAIENPDNVCFNCLKETIVHKIYISALGYGSSFDNFSTRINLCNDCMNLTNHEWWKLEIEDDEWGGSYKYESEILKFVNQMPIQGQELFKARYAYGACAGYMSGQDWIDYELDILPHEKCKEYCMYSPQEIEAYRTRFPICQHPVNRIWKDNSKGCWCPFGASGEYGQKCSEYNISDECYMCKYFKERTLPIRDISGEDCEDYNAYYKAKIMKDEFDKKFE